MNDNLKQMAENAGLSYMPSNYPDMADLYKGADFELAKFANDIIQQIIDNLHFHGHDDAVNQINWFKINKLGL